MDSRLFPGGKVLTLLTTGSYKVNLCYNIVHFNAPDKL